MIFGSLFSGIGGLDLGLERAGMSCAWQVEKDAFCRGVLAQHWPGTPRHEDISDVRGDDLAGVDLIAGGFPCQDVSQAGRRKEGIDGARSGLWSQFNRLIREVGPRFVLVENTPGLVARGLDRVLGNLAELGFDVEWGMLSAAGVGAPHLRRRVLIVAARRPVPDAFFHVLRVEWERGRQQYAEQGSGELGDVGEAVGYGHGLARGQGRGGPEGEEQREASRSASPPLGDGDIGGREEFGLSNRGRGYEGAPGHIVDGHVLPRWPPPPDDVRAWGRVPVAAQPAICGVAHGLPRRLDGAIRVRALREKRARLKGLGNAVVPGCAEVIGRAIMRAAGECV